MMLAANETELANHLGKSFSCTNYRSCFNEQAYSRCKTSFPKVPLISDLIWCLSIIAILVLGIERNYEKIFPPQVRLIFDPISENALFINLKL